MRSPILVLAALVALSHQTSDLEPGTYRATYTHVPHKLAGRVTYVRCDDLLFISFKDTLSAGLSMYFSTKVSTLRLGEYQAKSIFYDDLQSSATDTNLSGRFHLLMRRDWGFFPDQGSLRLTRILTNELDGSFSYLAPRFATTGEPQPPVTLRGSFRAVRQHQNCS